MIVVSLASREANSSFFEFNCSSSLSNAISSNSFFEKQKVDNGYKKTIKHLPASFEKCLGHSSVSEPLENRP